MNRILALLLALVITFSAGCAKVEKKDDKSAVYASYCVARAEYPEMAAYPDESKYFDSKGYFDDDAFSREYHEWREDKNAQRDQYEGYQEGLAGFLTASIKEFLSGTGGENRAYSPLNVYMALAMLAEITDGSSRGQILALLGKEDMDSLRTQARAIWNANYSDDGALTSVLASSLWLNESVSFQQAAMDSLAENYYASSFRGRMGSAEFDKALQSWLDEQTGGLLAEQSKNVKMRPETVLALATTVYFKGKWSSEFSKGSTKEGLFHLANTDGGSVSCDFMHKSGSRTYYWGDKFSSVSLGFEGGGSMCFLLPDEGVSVDELLADGQTMRFILERNDWENAKQLIVNMSVPKFDIASELDLKSGLMELGVTDVFDPMLSDFSPMTTDADGIFLDKAQHAARVTIDEEGCTAAAYTVMMNAGTAMPPDEEVDFVLDRPFLFVLTSLDGLPLFAGVVNDPS